MYQQHIDSLKAAAEIIDSYQFANLDLGDNGQPGASVGYLPNSVERAVVTTLIPKATKTGTGDSTVWSVGTGGVVTLFTVRDTGTPSDKSQFTDIDGSNGQSTEFVADLDPDSNPSGTISNLSVPVFSLAEEDIAVDEWVTLFQMSGYYFVLPSSSGGGGGEQQNFVIVANSGISAATWATAGTGTGDIWELSAGGASWSAIGGASVDIRNPWEETIASGSRMVCYKDGDYYVVIQASCPAE